MTYKEKCVLLSVLAICVHICAQRFHNDPIGIPITLLQYTHIKIAIMLRRTHFALCVHNIFNLKLKHSQSCTFYTNAQNARTQIDLVTEFV